MNVPPMNVPPPRWTTTYSYDPLVSNARLLADASLLEEDGRALTALTQGTQSEVPLPIASRLLTGPGQAVSPPPFLQMEPDMSVRDHQLSIDCLFAHMNSRVRAKLVDSSDPEEVNVPREVVDFLCEYYPEHLHGWANIWLGQRDLMQERQLVGEFFQHYKVGEGVAEQFVKAGFDTLETLVTMTPEQLDLIEEYNQLSWLPGHKVRLENMFTDIDAKVRSFRKDREILARRIRMAPALVPHLRSPYGHMEEVPVNMGTTPQGIVQSERELRAADAAAAVASAGQGETWQDMDQQSRDSRRMGTDSGGSGGAGATGGPPMPQNLTSPPQPSPRTQAPAAAAAAAGGLAATSSMPAFSSPATEEQDQQDD
ncbi:unnamed protein product [Vitrella brassicaformis CCMP3155]|uniref:SAM domain-containing protein n=2 Tax=Vitrella brassicaformis TaxID=1169539 RepID=A0A0G4EEX9_VITBC|nr:unnamed protein product [Vitrella brassicaformis CCMP3155]|eukprot:CEL93941.1 unnamed protein product [Vitrella brassicaformis CCMP3155]